MPPSTFKGVDLINNYYILLLGSVSEHYGKDYIFIFYKSINPFQIGIWIYNGEIRYRKKILRFGCF